MNLVLIKQKGKTMAINTEDVVLIGPSEIINESALILRNGMSIGAEGTVAELKALFSGEPLPSTLVH